jgi:hypothetical protein
MGYEIILLFMAETIHFYDKALGVPADTDMFIAVCGDDVVLVF